MSMNPAIHHRQWRFYLGQHLEEFHHTMRTVGEYIALASL